MSSLTRVGSAGLENVRGFVQLGEDNRIDQLPPEMLRQIFLNLNWSEFLSVGLVSRRWKQDRDGMLPLLLATSKSSVIRHIPVHEVNDRLVGIFKRYLDEKKEELTLSNLKTWGPQWKRE